MDLNHFNILRFLKELPPYIIHIKMILSDDERHGVSLEELFAIIFRRCENLDELYFEKCMLKEHEILMEVYDHRKVI